MSEPFDLIGIGIGPFNLSLAALLEKVPTVRARFFDRKAGFDWHPELMFADSTMQTTYLKDLVTPVDPTSPYSFLNYLVENRLFYQFIHTQRLSISRREFEQYCQWVSRKLEHKLNFNCEVRGIRFAGDEFIAETAGGEFRSTNICVATGLMPRIPEFAKPFLGSDFMHAKSPGLMDLNFEGKSVAIIGGGQTGIEIFRNALHDKWGRAREIQIITRRKNLEPLDETAFTNEYFTPNYVNRFWDLKPEKKAEIVAGQKLASDGNTPSYLLDLYRDLYRLKYVERDQRNLRILACRKLMDVVRDGKGYRLKVENTFRECQEEFKADIVILSTGFETVIPKALEPLLPRIQLDNEGRFQFKKSYAIKWDGPEANRIYAMNFSRHNHGIIDPQTSLMAWRSAVIINDLTRSEVYTTNEIFPNFVEYGECVQ